VVAAKGTKPALVQNNQAGSQAEEFLIKELSWQFIKYLRQNVTFHSTSSSDRPNRQHEVKFFAMESCRWIDAYTGSFLWVLFVDEGSLPL
jgi:hypothetical protein